MRRPVARVFAAHDPFAARGPKRDVGGVVQLDVGAVPDSLV